MRKIGIGFALVMLFCGALYLRHHHRKGPPQEAYAANRQVTIWNTSAPVRAPVAIVHFGERFRILQHFDDQVKVRTTSGTTGWVNQGDLLSSELWQKALELEARAATLPIEARGHTRVLSNLHTAPGRDAPRIRQLSKNIPVDLFERQAAAIPAASPSGQDNGAATQPPAVKKEDWWFIQAHLPDQSRVAGWVLGRFIDLDVPQPLPDYEDAADIRTVAWFTLDQVTGATGRLMPQYLVVGTRGPEGQPCDFNVLDVYTWSKKRQLYETAYVESRLCGKLPVHVTPARERGGAITFSFEDTRNGAPEERTYRMVDTIVRRIDKNASRKSRTQKR